MLNNLKRTSALSCLMVALSVLLTSCAQIGSGEVDTEYYDPPEKDKLAMYNVPYGTLTLETNVPEASIEWLNEEGEWAMVSSVGTDAPELNLPMGYNHLIRLSRPGYLPAQRTIQLMPGNRKQTVFVFLIRDPDFGDVSMDE